MQSSMCFSNVETIHKSVPVENWDCIYQLHNFWFCLFFYLHINFMCLEHEPLLYNLNYTVLKIKNIMI